MRIQDFEIIPTKCANMTEESDFKYGMNGGSPLKQDNTDVNTTIASPDRAPSEKLSQICTGGGRLKFFKDGKFILELERARAGWVSVPRKTFWPPAAPANIPGSRQEGSTSLSVSDDNSSIQSSPWQRDHCWKQTSPQRSISQDTSFFYKSPKGFRLSRFLSLRKRRRPFDTSADDTKYTASNGIGNVSKGVTRKPGQLVNILQKLWDRNGASFKQIKQTISIDQHAAMVSPRKRILRELERVTLDDLYNKRRAKVAQATSTAQVTSTSTSTSVVQNGSSTVTVTTAPTQTSSKSCSYSIDSLLGNNSTDTTDSSKQKASVTQHHRYQAAPLPVPYSTYYNPLGHVYPTYPPRYAPLWSQYHPSLMNSYTGTIAPPIWAHSTNQHRSIPASGVPPSVQPEISNVEEDVPLNLSKNSR